MDDFTDPNDAGQSDDDTHTATVADEEAAPLDEEPSSETHDIDEQMEQFGIQKEHRIDIEPLEGTSEPSEEQ